jgi:hypothetical protein
MKGNQDASERRKGEAMLKACPWCAGPLAFTPAYPVTHLAPGEATSVREEDIPAALRTVPAWICTTPHCRYREPA